MAENRNQAAVSTAAGACGGPGNGTPAVDGRIIEALIRAVYRYDSFVLKYTWIASELEALVGEDEFSELEEKMYEYIVDGKIKNVRMIHGPTDSIDDDVVAVAPCRLSEEQWNVLIDMAELYDYSGYIDPAMGRYSLTVKPDRPSLDIVMHNLIRAWCIMRYIDDDARAVYNAFKTAYKLEKSFTQITRDIER